MGRLIAFPATLAGQVRPGPPAMSFLRYLSDEEWQQASNSVNPAQTLLVQQSLQVKAAIREGALGQFDPISLEPQRSTATSGEDAVAACPRWPAFASVVA